MIGETKNAFRGAMLIWKELEKKYLPSLPAPIWAIGSQDEKEYWSRTTPIGTEDKMKDIWGLAKDERLSISEAIVLNTTFDNVVVRKENIKDIITSFNEMDFESTLKSQANILQQYINDKDCIAFCWNQTSVNGDAWQSDRMGKDEEGDEMYLPYNLFIDKGHWYLFKDDE